MIKLNDTNIIVGQIKQILTTFPLPMCAISADKAATNHFFLNPLDSGIYKKNSDGTSTQIDSYYYGKSILNITETLPVENIIYDLTTHLYFGKYLRFLRDFYGINLMSMYNCNSEISLDTDLALSNCAFNSANIEANGIYKVPISISNYTICTHSWLPITVCITLDPDKTTSKITDSSVIAQLIQATTKTFVADKPTYYRPFETLSTTLKEAIIKNLDNLVMLIKFPQASITATVVLEGEYTNKISESSALVCFKNAVTNELSTSKFEIASELLSFNNTSNRKNLLGTRIIEYLVDNVICPLSDNAEMSGLQRTMENLPAFISKYEGNISRTYINSQNITQWGQGRVFGNWHKLDAANLKRYIYNNKLFTNFDTIGYFDKDVEQSAQKTFDANFS